ncbi:hypothetical protein ACWDO7_29865 [Streptomyces sp. NPDC003656]
MTKPEDLSIPALAIYTELRDRGELIPQDRFFEEFPDVDYWAIVDELNKAGLYPSQAGIFNIDEPRGVIFTQRSSRPIRVD